MSAPRDISTIAAQRGLRPRLPRPPKITAPAPTPTVTPQASPALPFSPGMSFERFLALGGMATGNLYPTNNSDNDIDADADKAACELVTEAALEDPVVPKIANGDSKSSVKSSHVAGEFVPLPLEAEFLNNLDVLLRALRNLDYHRGIIKERISQLQGEMILKSFRRQGGSGMDVFESEKK